MMASDEESGAMAPREPRWGKSFETTRMSRKLFVGWLAIGALVLVWMVGRTSREHFSWISKNAGSTVEIIHTPPPTTSPSLSPPAPPPAAADPNRPTTSSVASAGSPNFVSDVSTSPSGGNKPVFGERVAVIMETKMADVPNLIPVILHFASVLGPAWTIVLYTIESRFEMPSSLPFRRAVEAGTIRIAWLPADTDFDAHAAVSVFLAQPWFWRQLESAHRVLMFQADSIICSRSNASVDDFLQWDMIGAPIIPGRGEGYNGGLSLRNPKLFLDVTEKNDFVAETDGGTKHSALSYEDQWFYNKLSARGGEVKLPTREEAMPFAVETMFYETPVGYHQPQRWQEANMDKISAWCPEVGMLIGQRYGESING